jgi:DNA-binding transcriptional ArsR family regulator
VLALLRARPMSAGDLAGHFDVSKPTMSAHFTILREAGLIEADRQGKSIIYRLKMSVLEEALMELARAVGLDLAGPAKLEEEKS